MAAAVKKKKKKPEFQIIFMNDLSPELFRRFQEDVISANLKEQVPSHMREGLIDRFVEAGLMAT